MIIFVENSTAMDKQYFISIFHDTRRKKENGRYPVKLRVYQPTTRKTRLYQTDFEYSKKEFHSIWETEKPRWEHNDARLDIQAFENLANKVAGKIIPFSFEEFERKLHNRSSGAVDVFSSYSTMIGTLMKNNQLGTASNYQLSLKSLKAFLKNETGKEPEIFFFAQITPEWLTRYESYMLNVKLRSHTTVSMYLRALRTIFNTAISDKEIELDIYPFGKKKYQVPAATGVKKALKHDQLKLLYNATPKTPEQGKAKDFWFFSYTCNGMNIKDIALLRYENLQGDSLVFYRAKTLKTSKANLKPISAFLTDHARLIIEKYGNPDRNPKKLIFPIIKDDLSEIVKRSRIQNFTRFINQNLKLLAKSIGLPSEISTYWARHSFATNAIRKGKSMEYVGEQFSHSNVKTTQNYFAGFEEDDKKEFMQSMMDF